MRKTIALVVFAFLSSLASSTFAEQRFPIDPEDYRQTITARVEATWEKIEKKLDHHKVSDDRKQAIRDAFDEAVARIDDAVDKASADGQISRGEAYRINTMTSGLRGKMRGKLAVDRASERAADKREPKTTERAARRSVANKTEDNKDEELDSRNSPRKTVRPSKAVPSEAPRSHTKHAVVKTPKTARR
jgi:hypothetical protein